MDIGARIEELLAEQKQIVEHRQAALDAVRQDEMNIQRLAGALAILNEQLNEEQKSPNGTVADEAELATP
jgi:hypothetical protein